jgi:hypothetical protein
LHNLMIYSPVTIYPFMGIYLTFQLKNSHRAS